MVCEYFKEPTSYQVNKELCCDVCCQELSPLADGKPTTNAEPSTFLRVVSDDEKKLLKETLKLMPDNPQKSSVFGTSNLLNLTESLIDDICKSACYIFTVDYLMDNFASFDSWLAHEILTVFDEVFEDILESELEKAKNLELYWQNDSEAENIPEWCLLPPVDSNSDSDSDSCY